MKFKMPKFGRKLTVSSMVKELLRPLLRPKLSNFLEVHGMITKHFQFLYESTTCYLCRAFYFHVPLEYWPLSS